MEASGVLLGQPATDTTANNGVNGHEPPTTVKTFAPIPTAAPVQREQREKKDSLKKREASSTFNASTLGKRKAPNGSAAYPSPQRYSIAPPRTTDFEPPREDGLVEHEGYPLFIPGQDRQLLKPDVADNKKGFRYTRTIADPQFPHKQFYRSTSPTPHHAKLSFEDADKWMHFTKDSLCTTNEKGWRMARANICAREGTLYYEVKIHRGIPSEGPELGRTTPAPHVRFGWARREAALDAPVGYDAYSYGVTDMRCETIHRSRPGKFFHAVKKGAKSKIAKAAAPSSNTIVLPPEDQHIKEGDVIGVEIQLPSLSLHQKIVTGVYNPAVDIGDGFDERTDAPTLRDPDEAPVDIIRDRLCVPYKGNLYFEVLDHISSKPVEMYADRTTSLTSLAAGHGPIAALSKDALKTPPNPNHEEPSLRTLPHSAIRFYKNGKLIGTAFENLLAFLPPASSPGKQTGAREESFDDGMVGYFPAVACFFGGIAEMNFGDGEGGFWAPPAHLTAGSAQKFQRSGDVEMQDAPDAEPSTSGATTKRGWVPGNAARAVGQRYKEQIVEDIVWDIVDEVDFFMQDGGSVPKVTAA